MQPKSEQKIGRACKRVKQITQERCFDCISALIELLQTCIISLRNKEDFQHSYFLQLGHWAPIAFISTYRVCACWVEREWQKVWERRRL